eukprot:389814-Pyramimonas_sp.AAC.1
MPRVAAAAKAAEADAGEVSQAELEAAVVEAASPKPGIAPSAEPRKTGAPGTFVAAADLIGGGKDLVQASGGVACHNWAPRNAANSTSCGA